MFKKRGRPPKTESIKEEIDKLATQLEQAKEEEKLKEMEKKVIEETKPEPIIENTNVNLSDSQLLELILNELKLLRRIFKDI